MHFQLIKWTEKVIRLKQHDNNENSISETF